MTLIAGLTVRVLLGVALGAVGGIIGYFAMWMALPPSLGLAQTLALLTTGVGIGAGILGGLAWVDPDSVARVNFINMGLAVLGGAAGAWATGIYGYMVLDGDSVAERVRTASILLAAGGATTAPSIVSLWLNRRRRPR